jgi:CRISPR-associated protein (TIGR03986 family)
MGKSGRNNNNQNHNKSFNNGKNSVVAPYNFVPFAKTVISIEDEKLKAHNVIDDELVSGELSYEIKALSSIFVGDGRKDERNYELFHKNPRGKYAIPGSTIRGLIRSNTQILGLSGLCDDIDNYSLMYREFAAGANKDIYKKILGDKQLEKVSVLENVKAGYIVKEGGKYYIEPAESHEIRLGSNDSKKHKMSYYVLSEKKIIKSLQKKEAFFDFFGNAPKERLMNDVKSDFHCEEHFEGSYGDENVEFVYVQKEETDRKKSEKLEITDEKPCIRKLSQFTDDDLKNNGYKKWEFSFRILKIIEKKGKKKQLRITDINNKETTDNKGSAIAKAIKNVKVHYIGVQNANHEPYEAPVYYKEEDGHISEVHEKESKGCSKGWVVSSCYMNEKKAVYIIPDKQRDEEQNITGRFEVPESDLKSFKIDFEKRKNTIKKNIEHFSLPTDEKKEKPVFYVALDKKGENVDEFDPKEHRLYFGFTPRLRLFYNSEIWDGIPEKYKNVKLDLSKSMFGFSNDDYSYKSKLSFSDAVLKQDNPELCEVEVALLEPKPTSYLDYINQDKMEEDRRGKKIPNSYNTQKFEIRGVKQYWLHKNVDAPSVNSNKGSESSVNSKFKALSKGTIFSGKVRFENLTNEEFGLLLWSLNLENNVDPKNKYMMNVGKGKPYGYGKIELEIKEIKLLNEESAYKTDSLNLSPYKSCLYSDLNKYIQEKIKGYKESDIVKSVLGGKDIDNINSVRDLMSIKSIVPKNENTRYMPLGNYQNRKKNNTPLPKISAIEKEFLQKL